MARLFALALVAFVALPLAPAASAQDAASLPRHGDVPSEFAVPLPLVGDAGSYERSIVRWDGETVTTLTAPALRESFRVEAPREHYDAAGSPHRVNAVHAWLSQGTVLEQDLHQFLDASDGRLVATRALETGEDYYTETTRFPGTPMFPQEWLPLCGLHNALQSSSPVSIALGSGSTVLFGSACRQADSVGGEGVGFVAVRVDPWGQGKAVGFQQVGSPRVLLAWFEPSIPYPVRLLEQLDDTPAPRFALLDLTGFTRGTDPAAQPGERPASEPLATLTMAPHHGVGPDETGVQHSFPWSQAWAVARADDNVQSFLADHPGAVVASAVYNEHETRDTTGPTQSVSFMDAWYFTLDDGRTAQKFSVTHKQDALAVPVPGSATTHYFSTTSGDVVALGDPVRAEIKASDLDLPLPDVASSARWWHAFASPHFQEKTGNGWIHALGCGCPFPLARTAAGYLRGEASDGSWHWEASFLHVLHDGTAWVLIENIHDADYGLPSALARHLPETIASPLGLILGEALGDQQVLADVDFLALEPPEDGAEGDGTGLDTMEPSAASAAREPGLTRQEATIVVAGAAGAAGLGWLAKAALTALFSRLRRDRVLDQPVRRQVMEAIEADPGIHLSKVVAVSGKGAGTVRHHVAKLVEAGLVEARDSGGYLCYFPKGARPEQRAAAPVMKAEGARRVLEGLDGQALGVRPLATAVGLAPSTVEHHLARLVSAGLVRRAGTTYSRTPQGDAANLA